MFDEKPNEGQNLPADIFEGVDQAPVPSRPAPEPIFTSVAPASLPDASFTRPSSGGGVLKVVGIVLLALIIIAAAGFFAYRIMVNAGDGQGVVDAVPDTGVVDGTEEGIAEGKPTTTAEPITASAKPQEPLPNSASLLDSDGDGLTNAQEETAGTSITKPDTDSDGLGDREEVQVYDTDPKKVDTDGDGYTDGQEVANGFNPNGTGRLFQVPE